MRNYDHIIKKLISIYPTDKCALNHNSGYELLVAVILSAQCTDKRVNEITSTLFKLANTPRKMVELGEEKLYEIIKSCGLGTSKSKNIIKMSKDLLERFDGEIPSKEEDLVSLAGVGEKTANVIEAVWFNSPAFAVDTHVFRLANKIGMTAEKTPHNVMVKLKQRISKDLWIDGHYAMVLHGRNCCTARNPMCESCVINGDCAYNKKNKRG